MVKFYIRLCLCFSCVFLLVSCSVQQRIGRTAAKTVIQTDALKTAHVGISIFEPATNRYWYNYQGDHYFVPASNTKIFTCYAAMKYLGDSVAGLRYGTPEEPWFREHALVIQPTGDPTFLHRSYPNQPVFDFLKSQLLDGHKKPGLFVAANTIQRWAPGWSWDDYLEPYMAERSSFPVFGNTIAVSLLDTAQRFVENPYVVNRKMPRPFLTGIHYFDSLLNIGHIKLMNSELKQLHPNVKFRRNIAANDFEIERSNVPFEKAELPFVTHDFYTAIQFLSDTFKTQFAFVGPSAKAGEYYWESEDGDIGICHINKWNTIYSQPLDSVLRPMMQQSDNFLAEQSLLMVSNKLLGVMNDQKIRDTLLQSDFNDLPQKPRWEDGSGLSRYNLFTPQDFVFILHKMQTDFGMQRLQHLFATGGEGTLRNYFRKDGGYVFAKTGSMSGVMNVSGYLYTHKNKLLLFSILINNQQAAAATIRRAIEVFVHDIRMRY